jgi:menaquinone-dependent protoporphyrinogen oxidase
MRVLVAYATAHGSTRGIAERIGARLDRRGHTAEVRDVSTPAPTFERFDAFVIGSAIHGGSWLEDGAAFGHGLARTVGGRPVWLFSVSSLGDESSFFPPRVAEVLRRLRKEPRQIASLRAALGARGHRNFAGAVEPGDWSRTGRVFLAALGGRHGDHRDWAAIDAWTDRIADELGEAEVPRRGARVDDIHE